MSITLQAIITRLSNRLHDINDVSGSQLINWATDLNNYLYKEMKSVDPERFIISAPPYIISSSPSIQALPVDFRDIQETGCAFFIRDSAGNDTKNKLTMTSFGSIDQGCYINGSNVVFTGLNTATTIILRYIPTIAKITSPSGVFIVPDEEEELLELGMVNRYYRDEEDLSQIIAEQDFIRVLSIFLSKLKKSPNIFEMSTSINCGA